MMKNILMAALLILALGQICHFGLPWWALVVVAAIVGGWLTQSAWQAFLAGFLGGGVLWLLAAWVHDSANESALSGKVGLLFQGVSSFHLLLLTSLMGGLLAALGAMTGKLGKDLLIKPSRRNYLQEKRRR
jgi:hypothetical protein